MVTRWRRRLLVGAVVGLLAILAVVLWGWWAMDRWGRQHAEFLSCGKTINAFLKSFAGAVKGGDPAAVLAHYGRSYASPGRGVWQLDASATDVGGAGTVVGISYRTLAARGAVEGDHDLVAAEWAAYLRGLAAIEAVRCKINLIEAIEPDRSARLTVNYNLRGTDAAGQLVEDRFTFRWWIERQADREGEPVWRIVRDGLDEASEQRRVAGAGTAFVRLDPAETGIDFVHRRNPALDPLTHTLRFGVIEHAAGGVAASDYDGDGRVDLFFTDGVDSRLYRNVTERGATVPRFADVTATAGLGGVDQAHCGLFADFDNDGDQDLVVTRYLVPSRLFCNDGTGLFADCGEEHGFAPVAPATSAAALDYDQDGYLDLYLAANGDARAVCPDVPFYATNAESDRLFRNLGGARFVETTEQAGVDNHGWSLAVAAADYDGDGRSDLMVANDFGRKVLYRNQGDGTFRDVAKQAGVLDFSGGMGVAFGDLDDDGRPDLYTSNINSNQRWFGEDLTIKQYVANVVRTRYALTDLPTYWEVYALLGDRWRELGKMVGEGNSLFANQGDGTFDELHASHTRRAGWSWGVGFFDFDNDADLDLYAANGWITGKLTDDL